MSGAWSLYEAQHPPSGHLTESTSAHTRVRIRTFQRTRLLTRIAWLVFLSFSFPCLDCVVCVLFPVWMRAILIRHFPPPAFFITAPKPRFCESGATLVQPVCRRDASRAQIFLEKCVTNAREFQNGPHQKQKSPRTTSSGFREALVKLLVNQRIGMHFTTRNAEHTMHHATHTKSTTAILPPPKPKVTGSTPVGDIGICQAKRTRRSVGKGWC